MSVTEYDIEKAYRVLIEAKVDYENALEKAIFYRSCRDASFTKDIASGKVQGKNVEERTGNHRTLRAKLYTRLAKAERAEKDKKLIYDIASINVEKLRMMMRLMEVRYPNDSRLRE